MSVKHIVNVAALTAVFLFLGFPYAVAAEPTEPLEIAASQDQSSSAVVTPARMNDKVGIAVVFTGTGELHYYAKKQTVGDQLKISAAGDNISFGQTVFPKWKTFYDPGQEKDIEVYAGDFTVFVPIESFGASTGRLDFTVTIQGIACTSEGVCLRPFEHIISAGLDPAKSNTWTTVDFEPAPPEQPQPDKTAADKTATIGGASYNMAFYLVMALLAGLSFNIMPCVLPVLPLIISRLVSISKESSARRISLGIAFCAGIILFFAFIGAVSAVLRFTTGTALNLNDPFRNPTFDIVMGLFLVMFFLFMFDVYTISLPSSITGKSGAGTGFGATIGTGALAALLSTPCSGAILGAVLVWAQTQPGGINFIIFVIMGIGMALPYLLLVLVPAWIKFIPRPGRWMDIFKKTAGFALLLVAIKPLSGLPKDRLVSVLSYAVVMSFAVWMWGCWVNYSTPTFRKILIRSAALLLAIVTGFMMLPARTALINWNGYERAIISRASAAQQPVLIDFTADWCTNCKVVDAKVYQNELVADLLGQKGILAVKADTSQKEYPASIDMQEIYGLPGTVPVTLIILPGGKTVTLTGIFARQKLIEILEQLPDTKAEGK